MQAVSRMDIKDIVNIYKEYSTNNKFKTKSPRTYLAELITKISSLFQWCSESGDNKTDRYTGIVHNASVLYKEFEDLIQSYNDVSEIYKLKGKEPSLLIDNLADIFILFIIYISVNNLDERFLEILEEKLVKDSENSKIKSRFKNKRIDDTI